MKRLLASLMLALVSATTTVSAATATDAQVCADGEGTGAVAACSRLIDAGQLAGREMAVVYHRRCVAYNNRSDGDRALADCDAALKSDATYLPALVDRCWSHLTRGDVERAAADCDEAVRRDVNNAAAYNLRAVVWQRKGDVERALADFALAIKADPKFPFPYLNRCRLLADRWQLDLALADCDEAVRLRGDSPSFLAARCFVFNQRGDAQRALADCEKAIALDPTRPGTYVDRCNAWLVKGDPDRAIADCNEALRLNPKQANAFNNRCWAHNVKHEPDAAIADCNEALRLGPARAYMFNNRGDAWRQKGDKARAVADYGEATRLDPRYPAPLLNRGALYEETDKLELALADVRAAAALRPESAAAKARVQRVETKIAEAGRVKAAGGERRVALLIGNGQYAKGPSLSNPRRDTETIAQALNGIGFAVVTVARDLPRGAFVAALQAFAREADRSDWALVYYAGHGIEVGGTNYLIPVDATLASDRDVALEAIALDQVLGAVEGARKLRLVVLDACRDNPFRPSMSRSGATRSIAPGLAPVEPDGATLVVFAAKAGQVALDGAAGNSPFAAALAKHIATPGLEVNFLFRKVRDDVLGATAHKQEPFTYGSLPAEPFYFRHP